MDSHRPGKPGRARAKRSKISEHIMFETIMSHSSDSIYFKDKDSRFIYSNRQKLANHGVKKAAAMIGKTDFDYFNEENAKRSLEDEREILKTGRPVIGMIEKLVRLDGRTTWSSASKYPLNDKKGRVIGTWGVSRDITEYEMAKEALRLSEAKHKAMIDNITDVIMVINADGVVTYTSPNIYKLFGWESGEIVGAGLYKFIRPETPAQKLEDCLTPGDDGAMSTAECRFTHRDGSERAIHMTAVNLISNPDISGILVNFHDISESKKREKEILYLSYHDTLTGLYNRAFFDEEKRRLDTGRQLPISIIMGDVNGLKLVNDAFGHGEGDRLLTEIANILKTSCRQEDIVARVGGDEFCILLPRTRCEDAQAICARISGACGEYQGAEPKHVAFHPSISLGYATKNSADESIDGVQKNAEDFMYKRKLLEHKSTHSTIISSIKATMNETSHETEAHSERMIRLSRALGREMELSDQQMLDLELLATLHDIGKICIKERILSKPDKLSEDEWAEIRKHPEAGCRITQASMELTRVAQYILCHHERWDGCGYPSGLAAEQIPLLSRVIAVVDAYDAMTQERPYRKAMTQHDAVAEITRYAGRQFDPQIAKTFIERVLGQPWAQDAAASAQQV